MSHGDSASRGRGRKYETQLDRIRTLEEMEYDREHAPEQWDRRRFRLSQRVEPCPWGFNVGRVDKA